VKLNKRKTSVRLCSFSSPSSPSSLQMISETSTTNKVTRVDVSDLDSPKKITPNKKIIKGYIK